ncbi:hypothetical protein PENTCL1PPCAC_26975, partial [Pristionchus entomophagus]
EMAFNRVVLDAEELTAHLGKEQLDLFDTKCIAAIYRDTDGPKRARTEPEQVLTAASATYLALAVENTLNIFTTAGELGYICSTQVSEEELIVAMKWMADTGLLVVATSKATLRIYSVDTQAFIFMLDLSCEWKSCCLDDFYNKRVDGYALFVSPDTGVVYRVVFDAWVAAFGRALAARDADAQLEILFKTSFSRITHLEMGEGRFEKMTALSYSSVGGCCLDGAFRMVQQPQRNGQLRVTIKRNDMVPPYIRARLVGNGTILAVLTKEGTIKLIDVMAMTEVDSLSIPRSSSESITDFAFLEWPGAVAEYEKVALIVQKKDKTEMQIREVISLGSVAYTHQVVEGSFLVQLDAPSDDVERLALVIEPADGQDGFADQCVCVRDVVETQPEQRLTRLIARGMLEEAERFALENKLDVQLVHSARVSQLLRQLEDRPEDEGIFHSFIQAVDKVDRESKGDWVLAAITPLKKAEWISRLLEYAEEKGVVEPTASSLASIAYNFATYRMVFGPNAEYGSVWADYQYSCDWTKQWLNLLSVGMVASARIIWHRYPSDIRPEVNEGLVEDAIRATSEMLRAFPDQWQFAIDHLEADVMMVALSGCEDTNQVYKQFIELLVLIATTLEKYELDSFPDNALYAVSAIERLVNRQKKNALTSMRAAEFMSSSSRSVEAIEAMYKRSRDLRAIKRLKETYECPLSYEKYKELSTKEICHEILQRSVQNPAQVRDRIDRIARPFMEEHSLPVDETLLGHIEKVTSIARCQTSSEPLDVHCLLVTDAINSVAVRARAVLKIADSAPIPWCSKLLVAVQNVMGDTKIEQKIKDELNLTCDRMRLGAICQDFGLGRDYVDSAIDSYADFAGFIRFLLTGSRTSTREITDEGRYDIAAECVSIFDRLRPGSRPSHEAPRVDVKEYVAMLVHKNDLRGLHKFVEKNDVIDETIDMLVTREETADYAFEGDKEWQSRRTCFIVAINSLIQRHRRGDVRWKEIYEEMRKMLTLVTRYDMDVSLLVLRSPGMRALLLHKYMKRSVRKLSECVELSSALGLSHDETFLALLDYSAPICTQKQELREDEVDVSSALYLCKKALEHAQSASTPLLQHIVHVAELAMKRMMPRHKDSPMTVEECVQAENDAQDLDEVIMPAVLELDTDLMVTDRALSIHRAVRFIRETVRQMQQTQQLTEGGESRRNSVDEEDEDISEAAEERKRAATVAVKDEASINFPSLGLSNRRRVGAYDASMDNPILGTADTMRVVCSANFMIDDKPDPRKKGEKNTEKRLDDMEERWVDLFTELDLASQYMLLMHARVLYAVWGGRAEEQVLKPLVEGAFAERLVQQHPCDLPLLATLFATVDEKTAMDAISKLFRFASKEERKSPQTMLNVCRLAQLMVSRKEGLELRRLQAAAATSSGSTVPPAPASAMMQTPASNISAARTNPETEKWKLHIKKGYTRAMWEKRLGKKKIIAHTDAVKAVREFATNMLPAEIVREYLAGLPPSKLPWDDLAARDLTTDKHERLLAMGMASFLAALLTNAVKAKDDLDRDGFLVTADNTIELELSQTKVYDGQGLRSFLCDILSDHLERECCPYAHEVIQFVLAKLFVLGDPNDERWKNGKKVADFICLIPRAFSISDGERVWFTERRADKNMDADSTTDGTIVDDLNLAQMPETASTRLPFHLLLRANEGDLAKFVVPLVWHEITLGSLQDWYNLLREVHSLSAVSDMKSEKLKLKRHKLITKAVMKYIKAAQEQNDQLSEADMEWIQERLYAEKNVNTLLYTFGVETSHVAPQGNTRIQLMQLGYNVTKKFLSEQPETAPDRSKILDQQQRLRDSLREMNTKRLLQSKKILNDETKPCVKEVARLISRIYDRFINWDEPTDVEQKCALIEELAKTNDHDLEETHRAIIDSWLCGESGSGEGDDVLPDVDMNDTMGSIPGDFGGGGADGATRDEEDYLPIPFYDEEVTRIVHVVRLSKQKQNLIQSLILNYVNMSSPPGGHSTHIRAVSTLLRSCTDKELAEWAPATIDEYAGMLDTRLTRRLVERSLGAAAYAQFEKTIEQPERLQQFIRNLLMSTQRNRPGTAWLATVLTMDYYSEEDKTPIVDQKLVDHMLSKLNQDRKYALLGAFLKFCSSSTAYRNTRNLNVLWGRTIESAMKELENESTPVSSVHEWLLFALSCPTAGNQALESLKRLMEKRGATVGAYLVKLASSYTKSPPAPSPDAWRSPKRVDYPVKWAEKREDEEEENEMDTTSY